MNNDANKSNNSPGSDSPGFEMDWDFYRRFMYEIWEEKSLQSLSTISDADFSLTDLSSESLDIPLGCEQFQQVIYSPRTNKLSLTSRSLKNPGQNPFLPPRPIEGMAAHHFQGDAQEKTCPKRSGGAQPHSRQAIGISPECCTQCKEKRTYPSVILPQRNKHIHNVPSEVNLGPIYKRNASMGAYGRNHPQYIDENLYPREYGIGHLYGNAERGSISANQETVTKQRSNLENKVRDKLHSSDPNIFRISEGNSSLYKPEENSGEKLETREAPCNSRKGNDTLVKNTDEEKSSEVNMCLCGEEIKKLRKELQDSKNQIMALSLQMEDQSSHLQHLIEERRRSQPRKSSRNKSSIPNCSFPQTDLNPDPFLYPQSENNSRGFSSHDHQSMFSAPHRVREEFNPYSNEEENSNFGLGGGVSDRTRAQFLQGLSPNIISELSRDPNVLAALKERFLALQMQNIHLNLFLKREEERRHEVEADLEKERNYIKKLEDNIQNMRSSRVVMDPLTYREMADNYIAARKQPVRRTHTCMPCIGKSDLVCDLKGQDTLTVHYPHSSNSCPSSPLGSKIGKNKSSMESSQLESLHHEEALSMDPQSHELGTNLLSPWSNGSNAGASSPIDQEEYYKLLENLEKLNTSPS